MTKWTRAVAWFWLIVDGYAAVICLFGSWPIVRLGFHCWITIGWIDTFRITVDFAILIALAALALLNRAAWGWWVLVINAVLTVLCVMFAVSFVNVSSAPVFGSPVVVMICYLLGMIPVVVSIIVLTGDPPWKWTRIDPCDPAEDSASPPAKL